MRFMMRIRDPLKQWKLSPMDMESRRLWEQSCPCNSMRPDEISL